MDYLEKFNSTFSEFIDDIIRIFPHDSELRMYKTAIRAAVCLNDKLALNIFTESLVSTYGPQILARDESFFLQHDYSDITPNVEYNALINKIKQYWTTMNEDNRNAVWKYFKVLILLSNKINNK